MGSPAKSLRKRKSGFRVQGLGFRAVPRKVCASAKITELLGFYYRVHRPQVAMHFVRCLGFRVWGLGFRVHRVHRPQVAVHYVRCCARA
jgi:hypothetical protein